MLRCEALSNAEATSLRQLLDATARECTAGQGEDGAECLLQLVTELEEALQEVGARGARAPGVGLAAEEQAPRYARLCLVIDHVRRPSFPRPPCLPARPRPLFCAARVPPSVHLPPGPPPHPPLSPPRGRR